MCKRTDSITSAMIIMMFIACAIAAVAGDVVSPQSVTFTNYRGEGVAYISSDSFYRNTSILMTNCVLYATSDTTTVQALSAVEVELTWGTESDNNVYTGTVQNAAAGTWWHSITIPTNWADPFLQIKITDENSNVYIYPWKKVHTRAAL